MMSETITTLVQSLRDNFKEKASSQLYGCILTAWIAYNWKPLAIFLLSDETLYLKIRHMSAYASPERQFWDPLLWGTIIAICFPLANCLYGFLEIITSGLIHSKNAFKSIVISITTNYRNAFEFRMKNNHKIRQAELEYEVAKIAEKKAESERNRALLEAEFTSLEEARAKVNELTQQSEEVLAKLKESDEQVSSYLSLEHDRLNIINDTRQSLIQLHSFLDRLYTQVTINPTQNINHEIGLQLKEKLDELSRQAHTPGIENYESLGFHGLHSGNYHTLHDQEI
ncbi:hypothetical protein QTN38_010660 [Enterobacter cloacae subsp. cloacae]|uniref:hypothetical protein n=1 Tax=Enterobacter cloacae TaxID=550 RepID=UPI0025B20E86|nr:hypothetical protein [Enterobacter cloacae]WLD34108.1 hypothetical protein QTN38_010660 [Enterobacter cloacae subsp. cloacae]